MDDHRSEDISASQLNCHRCGQDYDVNHIHEGEAICIDCFGVLTHQYFCVVCQENHVGEYIAIDMDDMCLEAFKTGVLPQFLKAVRFEAFKTPKYAGAELNPREFVEYLPNGYVQLWEKRRAEWTCPWAQRVICKHLAPDHGNSSLMQTTYSAEGAQQRLDARHSQATCEYFFGSKTDLAGNEPLVCPRCVGRTCPSCTNPIHGDQSRHVCEQNVQVDNMEAAFEGLLKGKDYQACPMCSTRVFLGDGCNHLICEQCDTDFCWLCGKGADHLSRHWNKGSCPLYGRLEDGPIYGNEMMVDDDDDDNGDDLNIIDSNDDIPVEARRHEFQNPGHVGIVDVEFEEQIYTRNDPMLGLESREMMTFCHQQFRLQRILVADEAANDEERLPDEIYFFCILLRTALKAHVLDFDTATGLQRLNMVHEQKERFTALVPWWLRLLTNLHGDIGRELTVIWDCYVLQYMVRVEHILP